MAISPTNVDWREGPLGDFIELKRGFDLPTGSRMEGSIPVVSSSGPTATHNASKVPGPGVVTGRYGTIGSVFYVTEDFWPLNTTLYVKDFKGNDPRFVSYFLRTVDYSMFSDKAAVPGVNRNHLHRLRARLPPPEEQRSIGRALGALDDKIELNQRMNRTLEETVQAIFKSWFVDFDPVRGISTVPDDIRHLLPERLVDSSIGLIPDGWGIVSIYDVARVEYGAPYTSGHFNRRGEGNPLVRIRDLASHEPEVFTSEMHTRQVRIAPGDLVVGMDGEFRPHLWRGPTSVLNQRLCAVRPLPGIPHGFLLEAIRGPLARFENAKTGTTVIHLGKGDIDTFRVVLPPEPVLDAFANIVEPCLELVVSHASESRTLAELLHTLLPKLISGEVRIRA